MHTVHLARIPQDMVKEGIDCRGIMLDRQKRNGHSVNTGVRQPTIFLFFLRQLSTLF